MGKTASGLKHLSHGAFSRDQNILLVGIVVSLVGFQVGWLIVYRSIGQRRSSRHPNPPIGGGARPTLGAQVSLKLLFGYVTIFSSADLFTTDLNCRKKLACDIISECNVILSRRL